MPKSKKSSKINRDESEEHKLLGAITGLTRTNCITVSKWSMTVTEYSTSKEIHELTLIQTNKCIDVKKESKAVLYSRMPTNKYKRK